MHYVFMVLGLVCSLSAHAQEVNPGFTKDASAVGFNLYLQFYGQLITKGFESSEAELIAKREVSRVALFKDDAQRFSVESAELFSKRFNWVLKEKTFREGLEKQKLPSYEIGMDNGEVDYATPDDVKYFIHQSSSFEYSNGWGFYDTARKTYLYEKNKFKRKSIAVDSSYRVRLTSLGLDLSHVGKNNTEMTDQDAEKFLTLWLGAPKPVWNTYKRLLELAYLPEDRGGLEYLARDAIPFAHDAITLLKAQNGDKNVEISDADYYVSTLIIARDAWRKARGNAWKAMTELNVVDQREKEMAEYRSGVPYQKRFEDRVHR